MAASLVLGVLAALAGDAHVSGLQPGARWPLMAVLLSVLAAVGWGASDYLGGAASRRDTPVLMVVAVAEAFGVVVLAPGLIARGKLPPANPRLLFAAVAGIAVAVELGLIFRALSRGEAFITAPTAALGTALAVTVGLLGGDPLGPALAAGLFCAVLGGGISAWNPSAAGTRDRTSPRHAAMVCIGAAVCVGAMLISLHTAGRIDPYWATAVEHVATSVTAGLGGLLSRSSLRHWRLRAGADLRKVAVVGAVGVGGDVAYAGASRTGALSIVSAIASLYPVATIALGGLLQRQRPTRLQVIGIVLALAGGSVLGASRS
jgi:drug/metabolite transporter (DMT)-like permease